MKTIRNYVITRETISRPHEVLPDGGQLISDISDIMISTNVFGTGSTRWKYRVVQNNCREFNNLSYTIHFGQQYVVAPMDLEVYVPPLPASIPELKVRIRTAIQTITADMRNELDYRVDVCRITKGAHIEHL